MHWWMCWLCLICDKAAAQRNFHLNQFFLLPTAFNHCSRAFLILPLGNVKCVDLCFHLLQQ